MELRLKRLLLALIALLTLGLFSVNAQQQPITRLPQTMTYGYPAGVLKGGSAAGAGIGVSPATDGTDYLSPATGCPLSGCNIQGSKTDPLSTQSNPVLPHAANNAALAILSPSTYSYIIRDYFQTTGDNGRAGYYTSVNICPQNGGAGDGGSCIGLKGAGSTYIGSAVLDWASVGHVANWFTFGAICDGGHATQDTAAALAAAATGRTNYVPAINQNTNYCNITSPILFPKIGQKLYGDGPQASKILAYTPWGGTAGSFTGSISGNTLTVTAVASGTVLDVNAAITGLSGQNNVANPGYGAPIYITARGSGTGGTGTYTLSGSGTYIVPGSSSTTTTVASESMYSAPLGVVTLANSGQEVRSLQVSFNQPSSPSQRSDLTTYPAAIMARQGGTVLDDLLLVGGTTCIDMGANQNAGNSYLYDIGTGCYDYGIRIDGSLDTVRIRAHHHFPFQLNAAQSAIFQRSANVGIDMGREDDFAISDSLCLGTTCIGVHDGPQGSAFGTVHNFDFDGAAIGINMMSGNGALNGSALTFSSGSASQVAIVQTAGKIMISSSSFFLAAPTTMTSFTGGVLSIVGSELNGGSNDGPIITTKCSGNANPATVNGTSATPCRITLVANTVERDPSVAFQNPWFSSQGNEIVVGSSNSVTPTTQKINGSTTPPAVSIANDTAGNRWTGNSSSGWANYVANGPMANSLSLSQGGGAYFGN